MPQLPGWAEELTAIVVLLVAVAVVLLRLPRIEGLGHSDAFRKRRVLNWLPLGLTYAFLYMARYNLKVSQHAFGEMKNAAGHPMMANADFSTIFLFGTLVYGFAFLINGPLTDRVGGKKAILVGAAGAALSNILMGGVSWSLLNHGPGHEAMAAAFVPLFSILYSANMYFQSFGAVAIVKVNAPWFHVRERGVFGAIFGILISLGIYFAYDGGSLILKNLPIQWVFIIPGLILLAFMVLDVFLVFDTPGLAGHRDFDTADASSGDDGPPLSVVEVFKKMMSNPIIVTIALVEFCSGFLRQSIMQWFRTYAKQTNGTLGLTSSYIYEHWGMFLCVAGILGGVVAGVISDHLFQSRRGPVAGILYAAMLVGALVLCFAYTTPAVAIIVVLMSMCVIGVHGMLSGTASMDFGGRKNVGIAVGIIDGFVYLGTAFMSGLYTVILPSDDLDASGKLVGAATDPANWLAWPLSMVPIALIGLVLATRVWNATPKAKTAGH